MSRALLLSGFFFALSLLAGCTSASPSGVAGEPLPGDVDAVVATRCGGCHGASPTYGAPMSLVTTADFAARRDAIQKRIHDDTRPMPPRPNPKLTASELGTLDAWLGRGLPARGDESCPGHVPGSIKTSANCTPDVHVAPTAPWTMAGSDVYACYRFDVPKGRSPTAIIPRIDNTKIVHHMIVFIAKGETIGTAPQGGCDAVMSALWRMVYGWAPGGQALTFPTDVGLNLAPDEHLVVQVHYSNPQSLADAKDTSGVDLCTTEGAPKYEADVLGFGSTKFTIPPRSKLTLDCDYEIPKSFGSFHVLAALPHMHQLGTTISASLVKGGGAGIDLGNVPNWDFGSQLWQSVEATVSPGDVVHTTCAYENPQDHEVKQGENTADEMCLDFVLYYPRASILSWAQPAYASHCVSH